MQYWAVANAALIINSRWGVAGWCEVVTLMTLLCQGRMLSACGSYLTLMRSGILTVQQHSGKIKIYTLSREGGWCCVGEGISRHLMIRLRFSGEWSDYQTIIDASKFLLILNKLYHICNYPWFNKTDEFMYIQYASCLGPLSLRLPWSPNASTG